MYGTLRTRLVIGWVVIYTQTYTTHTAMHKVLLFLYILSQYPFLFFFPTLHPRYERIKVELLIAFVMDAGA